MKTTEQIEEQRALGFLFKYGVLCFLIGGFAGWMACYELVQHFTCVEFFSATGGF